MPMAIRKALIVYFSPSGTTRRMARAIESALRTAGTPAVMIDLGRDDDIPFVMSQMGAARDNICIYVGSPVYASYAAPPVTAFLSGLPPACNGFSVPFVTWGGVNSGRALYDMARTLQERGYPVLGAGTFVAEHSLMWALDEPLAKGRPDRNDALIAEQLVTSVEAKMRTSEPATIAADSLAPDPQAPPEPDPEGFTRAKAHFPARTLDQERCTLCNLCADQCPVQAIRLTPYPEFGPECIFCFNCVRYCPEGAIRAELAPLHVRIRKLKDRFGEPAESKIYL